VLERRVAYLKDRILEFGGDARTSYLKAEIKALEWAMPILNGHIEANHVLQEQLFEERKERGE
jgi:hypothetical protein